jgi:two-component system LytT family response regulator
MTLKTLIADDEPLARERLRFLLSEHEEIDILGECRNGREVIAAIKSSSLVDLLFLDIQMPGIDGLQVIEEIGAAHMPSTVFVTAHNQYAVKAFEIHALDYLTKPVEPKRLQMAVDRVKERIASKTALMTQEQMKAVLACLESGAAKRESYRKRLLVNNGTKDSFVNTNEIEWVEAADYYSRLHVGAKSFMVRETIKQLSATLDPEKFVRIHRSAIVNVDSVREILRDKNGDGSVVLKDGSQVRMSRAGWQNLLAMSHA